ncbi:MAG: DUF4340 domain-containing protein [FCB group bacterium]|nr:DUF4340 domain-containing protein [FCB group bacterium]
MNKSIRNGIIVIAVLSALVLINRYAQNRHKTVSDHVFSGELVQINKVLIQKGEDAIELARNGETWDISGNDTLVINQTRIDNLFDKVLTVRHETMVSTNPDKWATYSIDDSTGTHLALIDGKGNTIGYYVFGRSKTDWSHNYIRFEGKPEVYLTSESVLHHLNTGPTFWGVKPEPPAMDSLAVPMMDLEGEPAAEPVDGAADPE